MSIGAPVFYRWRNARHSRTISEKRFEAIAHLEAKRCKRIEELTVNGYTVSAIVRTWTGIGTWQFSIDFDQDGEVTGAYHIWSENDDSTIPQEMARGMSNTIRAYLSESDGQQDVIGSDTSLDVAIEIEMVRQEGVAIRKDSEAIAKRIRDDACAEAEDLRSSARKFHKQTVASAHEEAEQVKASARTYYDRTISSAQRDAEAIRQQALVEAREIKKDAARVAEERREIRARRRNFISKHRRALFAIIVALALVLAAVVVVVRRNAQVEFEAKLIPAGVESAECVGAQYREIEAQLSIAGFTNINCIGIYDLDAENLDQEETVQFVTIDGRANFQSDDRFPYDADVEVYYFMARQLHAPISSKDAVGMDVGAVEKKFVDAGFADVRIVPLGDLYIGFREKPDTVESVRIGGSESYSVSDNLRPDDEVIIRYHSFCWSK